MRVSLGRVLGAALPALLVFASAGVPSSPARAGELSTPLCADTSDIVDFFAEQANFNGLDNCESLCKKARAKCKEFLSKSKSCRNAAVNFGNFFEKETECDLLPDKSDRKECRQGMNDAAASVKEDIEAEVDSARFACDEIGDECISDCSQS